MSLLVAPQVRARILVLHDDCYFRRALALALSQVGHEVTSDATLCDVEQAVDRYRPEVGVIDLPLHDRSGWEPMCALTGPDSRGLPTLFLLPANGDADWCSLFNPRVHDYVLKPFSIAEFLLRMQTFLSRVRPSAAPVRAGDIEIDVTMQRVRRAGHDLQLTPTQFDLLRFLADNEGEIVSKPQILHELWGGEVWDPNLVEVHVAALRRALEAHGPRVIHTVRGFGYVFRT